MVQSWYQGGISIWDFTDSSAPFEIAYFDRGPIDAEELVGGGYWSSYWYDGRVYGTEIARGIDVFELTPSEHLSANEIAAAKLASQGGRFNPQQQFPVTWPAEPVVARAYVDQLRRGSAGAGGNGVPAASTLDELSAVLDLVESRLEALEAGRRLAPNEQGLADRLSASMSAIATTGGDAITQKRIQGLRDNLSELWGRLQ
jgi:hypothetical protein